MSPDANAITKGTRSGKSRAVLDLSTFTSLPDTAYVRLPTVIALTSTSANTVWRWVREGRLPKPHKLGPQVSAWKVGELRASLNSFEAK